MSVAKKCKQHDWRAVFTSDGEIVQWYCTVCWTVEYDAEAFKRRYDELQGILDDADCGVVFEVEEVEQNEKET